METETLDGRREPNVDALYAEAEGVLSRSANELRTITERLRQTHAARAAAWERHPGGNGPEPGEETPVESQGLAELARSRALLSRLELASRDLEDDWRFLERGMASDLGASGRAFVDQPGSQEPRGDRMAKRILEAQEQERALLAEELHDGPAQALANATFQVEIIERLLHRDPLAASAELRSMRALLERELERMRAFIHQLRPALDDAGGLASALADTAERLTAETGVCVELDLGAPEEGLDLDSRTAVLRVAQEALRNVGKHSGASRVTVTTRADLKGCWVLEVRDDGRGFPVDEVLEQSARRHFGLRFMRERARLVNAKLEITSLPATGTAVRLSLEPGERSRLA